MSKVSPPIKPEIRCLRELQKGDHNQVLDEYEHVSSGQQLVLMLMDRAYVVDTGKEMKTLFRYVNQFIKQLKKNSIGAPKI